MIFGEGFPNDRGENFGQVSLDRNIKGRVPPEDFPFSSPCLSSAGLYIVEADFISFMACC